MPSEHAHPFPFRLMPGRKARARGAGAALHGRVRGVSTVASELGQAGKSAERALFQARPPSGPAAWSVGVIEQPEVSGRVAMSASGGAQRVEAVACQARLLRDVVDRLHGDHGDGQPWESRVEPGQVR